MTRTASLDQWLAQQFAPGSFRYSPASEDASFRRYFRVTTNDGRSLIVMDAPPEHEDCRPFVKVARLFAEAGVQVPAILAEDLDVRALEDEGRRFAGAELVHATLPAAKNSACCASETGCAISKRSTRSCRCWARTAH